MRSMLCAFTLFLLPALSSAQAADAAAPTAGANPRTLVFGLKSPDAAVRSAAASRLADLGPGAAPAIPELMDAVLDLDAGVRREILRAFQAMGPRAAEAAPTIAILLRHEDADTRLRAVAALRAIGSSGADVVGALVYALNDEIPAVRADAATLLSEIGAPADAAIPRLVRLADKDPQDSVRAVARSALPRLAPPNKQAARMAAKLRSPDAGARAATATSIAEMGDRARPIVPQLLRALRDSVASVRLAAAHSVVHIAPDSLSVRKAIVHMISDPKEDRIERSRVANDATQMGMDLAAAVPDLVAQSKSPDLLLRKGAVVGLGIVRPVTEEAIRALIATLDDPDADARALSAESLGLIGPPAKSALPTLDRRRTTDRNKMVRSFSSAAFDRINAE
jgi:HEAT repeat protein